MENHISKNIWSAQTGRDQGERPQSWVRTGRRRGCGELEERSNHTEENSQRASKKVSLKGTDVQRLLETLSYRTKSPVHSNKQCTKERERLFRKKKTVIKTQGKWAK